MIDAIILSDLNGNRIIYKNYIIPDITPVLNYVSTLLHPSSFTPISSQGEFNFFTSTFEEIRITSISSSEHLPLRIFPFHARLKDLFVSLFETLDEQTILSNPFSLLSLLDEIIISGIPVSLHRNYITDKISDSLSPGLLKTLRQSLSKIMKNELYIDHYELIDTIIDKSGAIVSSAVRGKIDVQSLLYEDTTVKVAFDNNFVLPSSVVSRVKKLYRKVDAEVKEIGAVRFHENVKLDKFGGGQFIDFHPPAGMSEFMSYRYESSIGALFSISAVSDVKEDSAKVVVNLRGNYSRNVITGQLRVIVPVSRNVTATEFKCTVGEARFLPNRETVVWELFNFEGGRDVCFILKCGLSFPDNEEDAKRVEREFKQAVRVEFEIANFTISGFQIKDLQVHSRNGQNTDPCLRYSTKSGTYEVRIN